MTFSTSAGLARAAACMCACYIALIAWLRQVDTWGSMGHRWHLMAFISHVQVRQLQEQMLALQQAKEQSDAALNDHVEAVEQLQQDCTNWQQQAQAASQRAEEQAAAAANKLRQGQHLQVQLCFVQTCWLCRVAWQRCDRGSRLTVSSRRCPCSNLAAVVLQR